MKHVSQETKLRQKRGTGEGAKYIPWTFASEFNSMGTCSSFTDWKHHRPIQLLSIAELILYVKHRFEDETVDIREQFPILDIAATEKIAEEQGAKHPQFAGKNVIMTTDLLITKADGTYLAISCKSDREELKKPSSRRMKEKLRIEKTYWKSRKDKKVDWKLEFPTEEDKIVTRNIMNAVLYYEKNTVTDDVSLLKHLVATKKIKIDLTKPVMWVMLAKEMRENGDLPDLSEYT